jgi:hypothetical protein
MFNPQEQKLIQAADTLRHAIENMQCSHFESLLSINNLYYLNLYHYLERTSFARLAQDEHVERKQLKTALIETCSDFCQTERRAAPFAYETKLSSFSHNLAQMLNTPYFEDKTSSHHDPALIFSHALWNNYIENWDRKIIPQKLIISL